MSILLHVNENLEMAKAISEIAKQNANINNAIISLKYESTLKAILPTIYAVITLGVGFLIQTFFFSKSAKKELRKDVSKLYSDFAFYSKEYAFEFAILSNKNITTDVNGKLIEEYLKISYTSDTQKKIDSLKRDIDLILDKGDDDLKTLSAAKFSAIKTLHEIQFYIRKAEFDELIFKYESVPVFSLEGLFTLKELENTEIYNLLRKEKLDPLLDHLGNLQIQILRYIRNNF